MTPIITPQAWMNADREVSIRRLPDGTYGARCGYESVYAPLDIVLATAEEWLTDNRPQAPLFINQTPCVSGEGEDIG